MFEKIVDKNKVRAALSRIQSINDQRKLSAPMREAVSLLKQKGVPVVFYSRIGFLKGYRYPTNVQKRIDRKLSFPKMYQNIDLYEKEFIELFGEKYSKEYVEEIGRIPQVIKKGRYYCHEDHTSKYVNVINGKRVTCFNNNAIRRNIHIYGRCGVFGYAVEDADTMPSQIQKYLTECGYSDICVVNHGLWGGEDSLIEHNFLEDALRIDKNDVVVFYLRRFGKRMMKDLILAGMDYKDFTKEWHSSLDPVDCIYDRPGHMNGVGYAALAKIIATDLIDRYLKFDMRKEGNSIGEAPNLIRYLKKKEDSKFEKEIGKYLDSIVKEYPLKEGMSNCGAIVMNCNPFTKGHRYLIENASKQVDRLYIFVVEENKSFFDFTERFEMVKRGTEDIANVVVLPSGKFIISALTFPEYFMKDYVKKKTFDVSGDVEIFCRYIAPALSVKVRFAGEEPFDPVTENYNETMAGILPQYGIDFRVIPRLTIDGNRVVNATEVRRLLLEKKIEEIKEYVPDTTMEILLKRDELR